jgi:hypothetical protein
MAGCLVILRAGVDLSRKAEVLPHAFFVDLPPILTPFMLNLFKEPARFFEVGEFGRAFIELGVWIARGSCPSKPCLPGSFLRVKRDVLRGILPSTPLYATALCHTSSCPCTTMSAERPFAHFCAPRETPQQLPKVTQLSYDRLTTMLQCNRPPNAVDPRPLPDRPQNLPSSSPAPYDHSFGEPYCVTPHRSLIAPS